MRSFLRGFFVGATSAWAVAALTERPVTRVAGEPVDRQAEPVPEPRPIREPDFATARGRAVELAVRIAPPKLDPGPGRWVDTGDCGVDHADQDEDRTWRNEAVFSVGYTTAVARRWAETTPLLVEGDLQGTTFTWHQHWIPSTPVITVDIRRGLRVVARQLMVTGPGSQYFSRDGVDVKLDLDAEGEHVAFEIKIPNVPAWAGVVPVFASRAVIDLDEAMSWSPG